MTHQENPRLAVLLPAIIVCIALSGCNSMTSKGDSNADNGTYDALNGGASDVTYATRMPVSSAQEAELLGDNAFRDSDMDLALYEYIQALKIGGDDSKVLYKIGIIHSARGNTQLAELAFRWALKEDPKNAGALTGLGILLAKKRDYPEARQLLESALQINARLWRAHNALGVLSDMQADYPRAQDHYRKALAIAGRSAEVLNNLGYSRYLSGNRAAAIAAFEDALNADPDYERAWRNLALVYVRERKYSKAIAALSKVEDLPKAYNDVGYVAMIGGELDDAETFFDEAIRLSPQYYELANMNSQRVKGMKGTRR